MKDATLNQATKILSLFSETPSEKIQAIIESGLLADLRDGNIADVDRGSFRKLLGLNILEFVGEVIVPAIMKQSVVRDRIAEIRKSGREVYAESKFREWFFGQTIKKQDGKQKLFYCKLQKTSADELIIIQIGGKTKAETTLTDMFYLMEQQLNGETGTLLVNGYVNVFYIRDEKNSVLRAVRCRWDDGSWHLRARSIEQPLKWCDGSQVFFRG